MVRMFNFVKKKKKKARLFQNGCYLAFPLAVNESSYCSISSPAFDIVLGFAHYNGMYSGISLLF